MRRERSTAPAPSRSPSRGCRGARDVILLSFALALSSCAPMTFSKEEVIPFDRYPSVLVVVHSSNSQVDAAYLAAQLQDQSGFARVTVDPGEATSLVLTVNLTITERIETDSDGNQSSTWDGEGSYAATDSLGNLVDHGAEDDNSTLASEVAEDVLDQIALHYFRPFRV